MNDKYSKQEICDIVGTLDSHNGKTFVRIETRGEDDEIEKDLDNFIQNSMGKKIELKTISEIEDNNE